MTDAAESTLHADIDELSVAESEIPEVRRQAQDWLLANNASDQKAIAVFALVLAVIAVVLQSGWAAVLALSVAMVIPFRRLAKPCFERGDLRRGIMWANLGAWYLLFPLVLIVPETLPIAMQNVIGPVILAATYLDRQLVKRLVPVTVALAVIISWISFTTEGAGLDETVPRWIFLPVLLGYIGANMLLVMGDIQELNLVHLRTMRRTVEQNRELVDADHALRESRRRLLVAADEERVHLERDIHDGAQQRLVALSMQLRLAAELAEEGRPPSSEELLAMHAGATDAVDELRQLAQGLYPARIQELGLAGALHAVARRSPVPIEVRDTTDRPIDDSIQIALYFVCVEAVQNATKHGDSSTTVVIELDHDGDDLVLRIRDDGGGFDPALQQTSRGLLNMADRVGALGGAFDIETAPGAGTTITARLPHDTMTSVEAPA